MEHGDSFLGEIWTESSFGDYPSADWISRQDWAERVCRPAADRHAEALGGEGDRKWPGS